MAIKYVDHINGKNRNPVYNVIASNPGGTTVLITCPKGTPPTLHEYVTGMQVVLSQFTAWLNNTWTITVVDDFSFTLDGAVWQATADVSGMCTPAANDQGGDTWETAWRNLSGATLARLTDIDEVRVAKSPDPVLLGDCDWSVKDRIIIPSGLVQLIDDCETLWTAAVNVTVTNTTMYPKFGSKKVQIALATAFSTGKAAYKALATPLDLSGFQGITYWFSITASYLQKNAVRVCLCSDALGDVVVDSFTIDKYQVGSYQNRWITKYRDGGGNLGANINSIAVYVDVDLTPTTNSTFTLIFDHILVCKENSIHLGSLISVNSSAQAGTEPWDCIRAIDGNIVYLDIGMSLWGGAHDKLYAEPIATYIREPIACDQIASSGSAANTIFKSGTVSRTSGVTIFKYTGGYNTGTDICDGETLLDGQNYYGIAFNFGAIANVKFEHFGSFRFYNGFYFTTCNNLSINYLFGSANGSSMIYYYQCFNLVFDWALGGNHNSGMLEITNSAECIMYNFRHENGSANYHVKPTSSFNIKLQICNYKDSSCVLLYVQYNVINFVLFDCIFADKNKNAVSFYANGTNCSSVHLCNFTFLTAPTTIVNYNLYGSEAAKLTQVTGELNDEWVLNKGMGTGKVEIIKIAQIAFNAGSQVTVTVSMRALNMGEFAGKLRIQRTPSYGIDTDIESDDINTQDYADYVLQFTPTVSGVVWLEMLAYASILLTNIRVDQ